MALVPRRHLNPQSLKTPNPRNSITPQRKKPLLRKQHQPLQPQELLAPPQLRAKYQKVRTPTSIPTPIPVVQETPQTPHIPNPSLTNIPIPSIPESPSNCAMETESFTRVGRKRPKPSRDSSPVGMQKKKGKITERRWTKSSPGPSPPLSASASPTKHPR